MAFVTDDKLDLLFDPNLIPDSVHKLVGPDLHIRPLASSDYERGHLKVMQVLTSTPDPGKEAYQEAFKPIGSVFLEYKFIRNLGICGHIEDIAVDAKAQGKGLGKKLILALTELSESLGSYKVILDCSEENKGFYEKCGYKYKGAQMAKYKE